jgi:hypothetical protein
MPSNSKPESLTESPPLHASKEFSHHLLQTFVSLGEYSVLFAAVLAPLVCCVFRCTVSRLTFHLKAVLFDVVALSQRWYDALNGQTEADGTACLALSGVSLVRLASKMSEED